MIKLKSLLKEDSYEDIHPGMDGVIKKGTGWLSNKGQFFGVPLYGHLEAIKTSLPISDSLKININNWLDELETTRQGCEDTGSSGEHPEWHCFEMHESEIRDNIIKALYKDGWIRVGKSYNSKIWEFEGSPDALKSKMTYIRKFKNNLEPGQEIKLTPRKV